MIVITYVDEAGTHGAAPHMVMGALVGRLGQWAYFDKKWRKMLRRNGIAYFHSKEWKHRPQCFRHVVVFVVDTLARSLNRTDVVVNFVLEAGHKNAGDAVRIFDQMKNDKSGRPVALGTLALEGKKEYYGLQGADLVSHTFYLAECENEEDMDLTPVPESSTLADAEKALKRNEPIFRNVLGPEQLKHIKESKFAYERARIEFGKRVGWVERSETHHRAWKPA
jgi:hypothetical protein